MQFSTVFVPDLPKTWPDTLEFCMKRFSSLISWTISKILNWNFCHLRWHLIYLIQLGPFGWTCNPSKWEADIWEWLEVRRSAMLYFDERQRRHWACWQFGHTGGTRGWLGVERWQLCLRDTSRSVNCHRRAAVGHWISLYVKCCRMVDIVPIWHTISIL